MRLVNAIIKAPGGCYVGSLAGQSDGAIVNCSAAGEVSGTSDVGGLVGWSAGTITGCRCTATVSGDYHAGGLVGENHATIADRVGKTSEQLQTRGTFTDAGWDFVREDTNGTEDISTIRMGQYPRLSWELIPSL